MKKIINLLLVIVLTGSLFSCGKKALEPTLEQEKAVETSITSLEDIQAILYGAYNRMTAYQYYGRDFIIYGEVRTDNCFSNGNSGRFLRVGAMNLTSTDTYASGTFAQIYAVIANVDIIINQDPAALIGDQDEIKNVIGQAYALRALAHFDLLKLFGEEHVNGAETVGIPYIKDFKGDLFPARNTVSEVKGFVEADLASALSNLDPALNDPSTEFITTYAVYALQSRVAVYFGDWATAKTACEAVINSGEYQIAEPADYAATFSTKGAYNVIFELAESPTDNQGINGLSYIYRLGLDNSGYGDIQVLDDLYGIFDANDVRVQANMIGWDVNNDLRNIGKYPTNVNVDYNIPLIRYEEVILNYAEALYNLSDPTAIDWLNMITAKRLANAYVAPIQESDILLERRRELCFEGFRFDDLARTHQGIPLVDPIHQAMGTVLYGDYNYAFPIPQHEIDANSNMTQNIGY